MSRPINQFNISQIADMFGFGRDTVRKRIKHAGIQPAGREGNADLFLLSDAGPAVFGSTGSTADSADPFKSQPTDRLAWFRSENERLKFELETGQLCVAEEVRNEMANMAKPMIAELEILPDILERDCGLLPDAVMLVQEKIDDLRNLISQKIMDI